MLAQSLQIALRRLATGFERDAQNIQRIEQSGHHVGGTAQLRRSTRRVLHR
jgi:hypothetical protein